MKAILCTRYGPPEVLQIGEVPKPSPKKNELCIKIHTSTVTSSDCIVRAFNIPWWNPVGVMMGLAMGFGKPRNPILGLVAAGEIESTGTEAKRFKPGDKVLAYTVLSPTKTRFGTYAQYICIPEDWIVLPLPPSMSYEKAAALPYPGQLAMHFLKLGKIRERKNVLIIGASGSIGTSAVQIARHYGSEVTGVCSTANVALVKSLGAKRVIDYTEEEYAESSERFDLILDAIPQQVADRKQTRKKARNLLTNNGQYVSIDKGLAKVSYEDLTFLLELTVAGKFKPVIDRSYDLDQIVEAHRYVESGHKKGNVIIQVKHD